VDVVNLHERRDEILAVLLFYVSDFPICWSGDSLGDSSFRVTEKNKKKNEDTKNWDEDYKEPKRKPTER
jgi:hypothetical protein